MKTRFLLFVLLICSFYLSAQEYQHVDSLVDRYPSSFQSVEDLANRIEKDFTTDADKVRAAYYWIANHIQYDYENLQTGKSSYPTIKIKDFKSQEDYERQYYEQYATYVLTYKTGVCSGYSRLLFFLCEHMNIKAQVIKGNTLRYVKDIGKIKRETTHAWNAVYFNDQWNLIDATWSTGNEPNKPNHFDFTDVYFCITPEKMILNHFPKDPKWQLLKVPKSKIDFYKQPVSYTESLKANVSLDSSIKGVIRTKTNDSITLRFKEIDTTKVYYYNYARDKYGKKITIRKDGNDYIARIPFNGVKRDRLMLFSKEAAMFAFRIIPIR
ncbi:transglutaminase domain-containing protein [Kordia sp.]|uniref:transglutaminase domain-containing protein n=1 Tax=Kordia sp. TaxID=1965332 RepID=UPI003B59A702